MEKIILFDGECNFCNWNVQFIIKRDPKEIFKFAPLQSDIGKQLVTDYSIDEKINSLILIENEKYYVKSTAVLHISKHLKSIWKCFYIFILIPKSFRDAIYYYIAHHRYRWFGKRNSCMIPSPEIKRRFLS